MLNERIFPSERRNGGDVFELVLACPWNFRYLFSIHELILIQHILTSLFGDG